MLTLEVTSGPGTGQSVEVNEEIVIGREDAGLVIDDPEISRRHARICPVDGGVMVEDLGSTNGTFVNGERASEPVTLRESGQIRLGTTEIAVNIPIASVADATRVRQVSDFDPDVTRARPIASDLTAPREIPTDLTAPRAVAPPQPEEPAPPPPGPPPPPPPAAPPPAPAAASGPPPVAIALIAGLVVAIVVVILVALV